MCLAVGGAAFFGGLPLSWCLAVALLPSALTAIVPERRPEPMAPAGSHHEQRRGDTARILALELSLDRVRSVLESLREGVFVIDEGGEVVLANPAARATLREPDALAVGERLWDVLPPALAEAAHRAFTQVQRDRPVRQASVEVGSRWFDLTAVRVHSHESGHDFGTAFLLVDVTRSHELSHLKDRFLSGISHELRTPLTNICAYSEILRTMLPGESMEWPEFVRIVHDEAFSLSRLVDAVFDYAQLESGEAAFAMVDVDAAAVLRSAVAAATERASEAEIDLACEAAAESLVHADEKRLLQVCAQLVDNALKFTPSGGAVRASVVVEDDVVRVSVDDSGPGVEPSRRDEVFEKFSQSRFQLTDKPAGTGIGLATCRAIVARLGGSIRVEESVLGGASFVVELPRVGGAVAAATVPAGAAGVEPADPSPDAPAPERTVEEAFTELFGGGEDVHELAAREDELVEVEWDDPPATPPGERRAESALAEGEEDG